MQGISARVHDEWRLMPARSAVFVVSALTVLALIAAFANDLPLIVRLALAAAVLALGGHALRRLLRPRVDALAVDGQSVRVRETSGARSSGELVGAPFVSPFYVGFRWRENSRRLPRSLGIFREQMDATDFRRLCAALRQRGE